MRTNEAHSAIEQLHDRLLFGSNDTEPCTARGPIAETHMLLAISALETAQYHMRLAFHHEVADLEG